MDKLDWKLHDGECPALSYWDSTACGEDKVWRSKPCYASVWDSWKDTTSMTVYHPYVENINNNLEVVQNILDVSGFSKVFITKSAEEGVVDGFKICTDIPLGLLKAAIITLRGVWEKGLNNDRAMKSTESVWVNEYLYYTGLGIDPQIAALMPTKITLRGLEVTSIGYQQHWMGIDVNTNINDLLSPNPHYFDNSYGSLTFPKVSSRKSLKSYGFRNRTVKDFFGWPVTITDNSEEGFINLAEAIAKGEY